MLVRKRGLGGLLRNRVSRILVPLGYGCLTIVPPVWGFIIYAASGGATFGVPESHENLWSAAALGDQTQINLFIENGWPLDDPDPFFEQSPLGWAVCFDHAESVDILLDAGADPSGRFGLSGLETPLHVGALFGRYESVRRLIEAGADIQAENAEGLKPADIAAPNSASDFKGPAIVRGLEIEEETLLAGRAEILRLLKSMGATPSSENSDDSPTAEAATSERGLTREALWGIRLALMYVPFFHHLWFLWVLCWHVLAFACVYWVLSALPKLPAPPS